MMKKTMKRFIFPLFLLATGIHIFLASWTVLHNDIVFTADIARDMFLLEELAEKKLVLIGPRSSVSGLFHGPLWSYLTVAGYLIGNGNPVIVGWWWIFLIIVFVFSSYFIAKRLFNKNAAMLFVLMTSLYVAFHANALFNPYGALFFLPAFFFFLVRYLQTQKVRFLLLHVSTAGAIVQFQMAIGLPLLMLSVLYVTIFAIKAGRPKHLLAFSILLLLFANFIFFNLKYDFSIIKNALRHIGTGAPKLTLFDLAGDRIDYLLNKLEFLRFGPPHRQLLTISALFIFLFLQLKENVSRRIYLVFLYFFFGFFLLSLFNRYNLLDFYVFPIMALVFLIFSSFITGRHKAIFLAVFLIMYALNLVGMYNYIKSLDQFIGKDQFSWKALFDASAIAYQGDEKEFGYLIYSPDIFGYGPHYAMEYARKVYKKNGYAFEKKPVTYLFLEPDANSIYISESTWRLHKVHVYSTPVWVKEFPSKYKLEKHLLGGGDYLPIDQGINPGLFYR